MKLLISILLLTSFLFAQVRVVVSDTDPTHGNNVAAAIDSGYGSDVNVLVYPQDLSTSLSYANSIGADMVVRSYVGAGNSYNEASPYYPNILTVMPSGSNTYKLVVNDTIPQVIVLTGYGVDTNRTGYNVEFNDDDVSGGSESSYSNGVVAGKLLKIYDQRNNGWWDARYSAQATASNFGGFTDKKGYGVIDVTAAIAYGGSVPEDPILNPPDPDSSVGAVAFNTVVRSYGAYLTFSAPNATEYFIYRNSTLIDSTASTTYQDTLTRSESRTSYYIKGSAFLDDTTKTRLSTVKRIGFIAKQKVGFK